MPTLISETFFEKAATILTEGEAKKRNDGDLFFGEPPEYAEEQVVYERNPKALSNVDSYLGIYTKLGDIKKEGK